jgi:phosphoglycerate kinase
MLKTVQNLNPKNKTVLLRVDFNVDLDKKGKIIDDFRMKASLPTINYLLENNNKVVILAHMGRPALAGRPDGEFVKKFSLKPLAKHLQKLTKNKVIFLLDCIGHEVAQAISDAEKPSLILLENLRFYSGEEKGDVSFARNLAELGDVYIDDAFGAIHRAHASISILPRFLPSAAGFLLQKEIEVLSNILQKPKHPLCVIIGGIKMETKLPVIKNFLDKADHMLLGGGIANTILSLKGVGVGKSKIDSNAEDGTDEVNITNVKIHLPLDAVASEGKKKRICGIGAVRENEFIYDIGPDTIKLYGKIIAKSKTIIWNGPMGFIEKRPFDKGTKELLKKIAHSKSFSVVGGGETLMILKKMKLASKISHVSTGGGAMLEFLAGKELPGIKVLED